jgi:hypothetical protein
MKVAVSLLLAFALVCSAAPPTFAEPRQLPPGTEIHLTLVTAINSAESREGDPFVAVLAQPVALDSRIVLPAGTRLHGVVGTVQKARLFSSFKGQAYMNLSFKTIEIESRLIPVQMSLIAIGKPRVGSSTSPIRKDVKITEGEVIQQKHDYKGDAIGLALGGGTGSTIGLIAGNVGRGMGIGFAVGAVYVAARKGKEVNLPADTAMLARLDGTVTLPNVAASNGTSDSNSR